MPGTASNSERPSVCILLATHNGAGHLDDQLRSIEAQSVRHIDIIASDDESRDDTPVILRRWQARWEKGAFEIHRGPNRGFAENFRSLIASTDAARADCFAFSDQDDIWLPDKLAVAAAALDASKPGHPQLYCGPTTIIDEAGGPIGRSPPITKPPSFRHALVQPIAGGNTMVMNLAAMRLLDEVSAECPFVSHDWWAYLWVTGVGGRVIYGANSLVLYRQHHSNLVGNGTGRAARLLRMGLLIRGRFRDWTDLNLGGLERGKTRLTRENADLLCRFAAARTQGRLAFLRMALGEGIARQSRAATLSLYAGIALGRI